MIPIWLYAACKKLGLAHVCEYDDRTHPNYVGFTAGLCYKRGVHGGRKD